MFFVLIARSEEVNLSIAEELNTAIVYDSVIENDLIKQNDDTVVVAKSEEMKQPKKSHLRVKDDKNDKLAVSTPKTKNPTIATILSACVPGAGQCYNGHWWKVPIIYGASFGLGYVWYINNQEYQIFKKEYKLRVEGQTASQEYSSLSQLQIKDAKDYYRRNLELTYIGFGLVYVLNIIDACVFAHLHSFDVSEDLSLQIKPSMQPLTIPVNGAQMTTGFTLNFTFK